MGICDNDHTEKYTIQLIRRLCSKYNVFIIATRTDLSFFAGSNENQVGYKKWQAFANVRIELEVKTSTNLVDEENGDIECGKIEKKSTIKVMNVKENKSMDVIRSFSINNSGFQINQYL